MGGGELPAFEEKEAGAEGGEVDVTKEIDKSFKLGFDRHEDVKRVLGSAEILLKCEAEEGRERSSLKDGSRRDATEKGARMGGLPNSDRSKREGTGLVRVRMRSKQGSTGRERFMRRLEDRDSESAKVFPEKKGPRGVGTRGEPLAHSIGGGEGRVVPSATSNEKAGQ
jgi:hypothetical protein